MHQHANTERTISALAKLGERILLHDNRKDEALRSAKEKNPWFEEREVSKMLQSISSCFLEPEKLKEWISKYQDPHGTKNQTIGLIAAANIPLVSFHDLLCILVSGKNTLLRCSERDVVLYKWILELLMDIDGHIASRIRMVDKLSDFDAVIATGSDSTSQYFRKYFSKVPNIIRGHRNSVAWITGEEDRQDLIKLGEDVYSYFGLGCRNVSMILIPKKYDLGSLLGVWDEEYYYVRNNTRYNNNYEYRLAVSMLNAMKFRQSETLLLIESDSIASNLSTLHYSFYEDQKELDSFYQEHKEKIQCIVGPQPITGMPGTSFGSSQYPELSDYADGIDTMQFLTSLTE